MAAESEGPPAATELVGAALDPIDPKGDDPEPIEPDDPEPVDPVPDEPVPDEPEPVEPVPVEPVPAGTDAAVGLVVWRGQAACPTRIPTPAAARTPAVAPAARARPR
jgi:hypothetical protein